MANQMIALQARNPQLPDPARQTAQMANMMNTAAQQRASQLQGERLRQEMAFEAAKEGREVATQTATMRQKDLDYLKDLTAQYRDRLATINPADKARYGVLRQEIIDNIPAFANELPRPEEWDQNSKVLTIAKADDVIKYSLATPVASLELSQGGMPRSVVVGGLNPEQRPVYDAPEAMAPAATPTAAPTAPQTNPMAAGATPRSADADPGSLGLVIASALETGVMSKNDYDKMLSIAQPQSRAKIAAWAQQNNIEIVPDAPGVTDNQVRGAAADFETTPMSYDGQTPQSQFAVFRGQPMQAQTAGLGGAPEMRQTLAQARTSTPLQMRDPRVSPAPGLYNVPTQVVAEKSQATRPSKQEVYDTELAKIEAARAAGPAPVTRQQKIARKTEVAKAYTKTQALMDKAYNPKEGVIALANKIKALSDDQKESITGYSGYIPSFRASSREADTLIGNLKGVVTGLGKDAAAASGAIGPMAVQEWKIVADMIAKLDLEGMTPRALDAQMNRIIEQVRSATNLAERVYDVQYGDDIKEYPDFKLRGTPPSPRTKTPVTKAPAGVSATEWKAMTPAERKLWQ